jgi:hypothetical protein
MTDDRRQTKRLIFTFDERSLDTLEQMSNRGQCFREIIVRDPETEQERTLIVPERVKADNR